MTAWLDPAIERTSGSVNEFLRELKQMIEHVRPAALDESASEAVVSHDGVDVVLAHAREERWSIHASVREGEIVMGAAAMHEHVEGRPSEAVNFAAELLRGQIEIRTTYRGRSIAKVAHNHVGGEEGELGETIFPGKLVLWRPKRIDVEVVDFEARG